MLEKRIYFVSIGLKSDWIVSSIKDLRPDLVYLLEDKDEKHPDYFKAKKELTKFLKSREIECIEILHKKEDEYLLLKILREKIEAHKKDRIYLNLCSGDRKTPSVFILSSFLFRSINPSIYLVSFNAGSNELVEFPSFEVKLPDNRLIEVLKEIEMIGDYCSKKKLSEALLTKKILKIKTDTPANRLMSLNRNFLQRLLDWNFIIVEGKNKNSLIKITSEGQKWLKFM